jgi:amino acid transporter
MPETKSFGTAAVFFTAIATILGAILFLRFGYALGMLGFWGVLLIILVAHMVTIPTAFAISEIATNQRVEGGGEYYIISRSFGLNLGGTIGIALFFSQAISVAFYIIAFTEAFEFLFNWFANEKNIMLPRQAISIPAFFLLAFLILKKGANIGMITLYIVVSILALSLLLFFIGSPEHLSATPDFMKGQWQNMDQFFIVFAIIFPAFTGMTAGVGLSGDLKNPAKSIPKGTIIATISGLILYVLISYKLVTSVSTDMLLDKQLVMAEVAVWGKYIIPIGLAASTISSAIGSILVAPRTLQALGVDFTFSSLKGNRFLAKGKSTTNEPYNATLVALLIAFVFVVIGDINAVAIIITMFFMVTYGSLCLISFMNHFGSSPSYRPVFKSHPALSLCGFLFAIFLMFKIDTLFTILAFVMIMIIYFRISSYHKERGGMESIIRSVLFQLNRKLQVYLQRPSAGVKEMSWHPAVVCVSEYTSERDNAFRLMTWVSYKHGFGTYIKFIQGYYSKSMHEKSEKVMGELTDRVENYKSNVYVDTIVSPSYTSAIAQVIQLPGISGMCNNTILFEFDKKNPDNLHQIIDNLNLVRSGNYDVAILGASNKGSNFKEGIHIWIQKLDVNNINLMIYLSYIIMGHPDWKNSKIKIFLLSEEGQKESTKEKLRDLINTGRLPISYKNVKLIPYDEEVSLKTHVHKNSFKAGLTMIGFLTENIKDDEEKIFLGYEDMGDVLFVNATKEIKI